MAPKKKDSTVRRSSRIQQAGERDGVPAGPEKGVRKIRRSITKTVLYETPEGVSTEFINEFRKNNLTNFRTSPSSSELSIFNSPPPEDETLSNKTIIYENPEGVSTEFMNEFREDSPTGFRTSPSSSELSILDSPPPQNETSSNKTNSTQEDSSRHSDIHQRDPTPTPEMTDFMEIIDEAPEGVSMEILDMVSGDDCMGIIDEVSENTSIGLPVNPDPQNDDSVEISDQCLDQVSDVLRIRPAPSNLSVRHPPAAETLSRAPTPAPAPVLVPAIGSRPGLVAPTQSQPQDAPLDVSSMTSSGELASTPIPVTAPVVGSGPGFVFPTQSRPQAPMDASSMTLSRALVPAAAPAVGTVPGFVSLTPSRLQAPTDVSSNAAPPILGSGPEFVVPAQSRPQNAPMGGSTKTITRILGSGPGFVVPTQGQPQNVPMGISRRTIAPIPGRRSASFARIQDLLQNIPVNAAPIQHVLQNMPADVVPIRHVPQNMPANAGPIQCLPQNIPLNVPRTLNFSKMRYHDLSERGHRNRNRVAPVQSPYCELARRIGKDSCLPVMPVESIGGSPSFLRVACPAETHGSPFIPGQWSYANLANPDPNANLPWELPIGSPGWSDLDDGGLSGENVRNRPKAKTPSSSGNAVRSGNNVPDSQKRKTPPTENLSTVPKRRMTGTGTTDFEGQYGIPWDPRPLDYHYPNANREQPPAPPQPSQTNSSQPSTSGKRKPHNPSKPASESQENGSDDVTMSDDWESSGSGKTSLEPGEFDSDEAAISAEDVPVERETTPLTVNEPNAAQAGTTNPPPSPTPTGPDISSYAAGMRTGDRITLSDSQPRRTGNYDPRTGFCRYTR